MSIPECSLSKALYGEGLLFIFTIALLVLRINLINQLINKLLKKSLIVHVYVYKRLYLHNDTLETLLFTWSLID